MLYTNVVLAPTFASAVFIAVLFLFSAIVIMPVQQEDVDLEEIEGAEGGSLVDLVNQWDQGD